MDILIRGLLLVGGLSIALVFIVCGLFFLGWVFSQRENGW